MRQQTPLTSLLGALALVAACTSDPGDGGADGPSPGTGDGPTASADSAREPTDGGTTDRDMAAPPTPEHVVINFDDLPANTEVLGQYAARLSFSSEAGIKIWAENLINIGQSAPNYLTAGGGSDVLHPLFIKFSKPVQGLKFNALSVTDTGPVARFRIFKGAELAGTVDLIGKGTSFVPVPVDLSAYSGVTRLEVVDITDRFGIAYDDFSFDVPR
jgi:hypothetical protein